MHIQSCALHGAHIHIFLPWFMLTVYLELYFIRRYRKERTQNSLNLNKESQRKMKIFCIWIILNFDCNCKNSFGLNSLANTTMSTEFHKYFALQPLPSHISEIYLYESNLFYYVELSTLGVLQNNGQQMKCIEWTK